MMSAIARWTLQFRLLVLAAAAGILALGLTNLPSMSVDAFPEFAPPQVEIQTEALGLSAAEVEQLITSPMEADLLNGVAWVEAIRSKSVPGLSSIQMVFKPGTDLLRARQLVSERLTQARALPNVSAAPVLMQPLSSTSRVMMVRLTSKDMSAIDMSVLARWTMKPGLLAVPGVANVAIWGQRDQQLQVLVDPARLQAKGVTLDEVIKTTGNSVWVSPLSYLEASTPGTGGFFETGHQRIGVQHVLPITTPEDLGQVPIQGPAGNLLLKDVATVSTDHQPLIGDALLSNEAELLLVIEKFPETNTMDVTRGVDEVLRELQPGLPGVTIDTSVYRQASFIEEEVGTLGVAALIALLLIVALFGAFFRSWRTALISLITIPVSLTAAALVLDLRGTGMNTMVLAGMALALAVIVGDVAEDLNGIARARSADARAESVSGDGGPDTGQGQAPDRRDSVIPGALRAARTPILYALLIMALALMPALFIPGENGALFGPLVQSYLLALVVSMIVALTVTAALAFVLPVRSKAPQRRSLARLQGAYGRTVTRLTRKTRWVFAAAAVVAVAGLALAPQLAGTRPVVPVLADKTLVVHWSAIAGTSDQEMSRITEAAAGELRTVPGVANVGGHVGRAITSDQVGDVSSGELWVTVAPDASYADTAAAVDRVIAGYAGLTSKISTYPQERIDQIREEADSGFAVRVFGLDPTILRQKAAEVQQILEHTAGVVNPHVDLPAEQPIAEVKVNLAAAQKAGVVPGDVRRAAAALLQGIEVGNLYEQQKVFSVIVKGNAATRSSLDSVRNLIIDTPNGGHARLGDVAQVTMVGNESVILHDDTSRRIDVKAEIQGRPLGDIQRDIDTALQQMQFPISYHAEILAQYAQQQNNYQWLWLLAAVAAAGILVLLQTATGSWRLAAPLFLGLILALSGGVLAAQATGGVNSLVALVAFAAVLGIAVRGALLLTGQVRSLRATDASAPWPALVVRGTKDRLGPVLMSTVITALALLPLALLGGVVGTEIILPLAVIIWGGLLTTAFFTLFVVPAMLLRFEPKPAPSTRTGQGTSAPTESQDAS
ncbi:efflux RND transporter permease subunit [Arthrobacter sp. ok362]|uniref:efflux RND transporter permease subunit n=1 Tax=Arthrobacter sp. ok362 TaxID=1761745 RepID=UPI0008920DD8|nr:efflux RND transporter permease subunit [Arthrobacter sp. ok362]SDL66693.1 Cu/Ag efflux pump CusA [Arthrobacter sp. ok362]